MSGNDEDVKKTFPQVDMSLTRAEVLSMVDQAGVEIREILAKYRLSGGEALGILEILKGEVLDGMARARELYHSGVWGGRP